MSPLCAPWSGVEDLCGTCADYSVDTGLMDEFLQSASETLFILSGQQFPGECEETIRPCSSGRGSWDTYQSTPSIFTYPFNHRGCGCRDADSCGCPALSQIRLPRDHVSAITEVKVDGNILLTTDYRLDPKNILLSTTDAAFPCCQDMRLDDDQVGTWSITYTFGLAPPALGVTAAAVLACELYMACSPEAFEGICRLPYNVTSIARQGVSIAKFVGELFTPKPGRPIRFGIPEIDLFLATFNPHALTAPSVIMSPDMPESFRFTE